MFELILCSSVTLLPDYLYRRYVQGKRLGEEITLYSVWFELRWGIIGCLMLTISLITMIFYFHPSTSSALLLFRTVPIAPEVIGRVAEVKVDYSAPVKKGDVLFTLDSSKQRAAVETARRKVAEADAQFVSARADVLKAEAQLEQAAGQFRGGEQLVDASTAKPGTIFVYLEPIEKDGLVDVTAGSSRIVNAYTSNHEEISAKDTTTSKRIVLHTIDTVGLVHAMLLRIQALMLPIKTLVLSGH
jgi:hypothetical protein